MLQHIARTKEFHARFEALDTTGLAEQEVLTKALLVRALGDELESADFGSWKMPVNQLDGIHLDAPRLVVLLSFRAVKDYDDYLARLRNLPKQLDDTIARIRLGIAAGLVQPRFLLDKVAAQVERLGSQMAEDSPFAAALTRFPPEIPAGERSRLRAAYLEAIRNGVLPAYRRFASFVKQEYVPRGRAEPGLWALPDGAARYAAAIRTQTTTSLGPDAIHELGLREVARIAQEMLGIARGKGFASVARFEASLSKNPALRAGSRERILELFRLHLGTMKARLPALFGRLPRAELVVVPVEDFREKEAAGAEYVDPAPDGSRPGRVMVNTGNFAQETTPSYESTAYHEGVPGHHLQGALQQELPDLPAARRHQWVFFNAFVEGWALYAERLAKETGAYADPYNDYGRLGNELLRAIRLVVDTGLHHKRWTREQAIGFFRRYWPNDEDLPGIEAEVDRYLVWPAQALGYKLGELRILELRHRATRELGRAFDLRRFHDTVLGAGSVPLDILQARVEAWISAERAASRP